MQKSSKFQPDSKLSRLITPSTNKELKFSSSRIAPQSVFDKHGAPDAIGEKEEKIFSSLHQRSCAKVSPFDGRVF